jgi:hypothetical protein
VAAENRQRGAPAYYTGIFVYQHGDQVETSRITTSSTAGEYEKLETSTDPSAR